MFHPNFYCISKLHQFHLENLNGLPVLYRAIRTRLHEPAPVLQADGAEQLPSRRVDRCFVFLLGLRLEQCGLHNFFVQALREQVGHLPLVASTGVYAASVAEDVTAVLDPVRLCVGHCSFDGDDYYWC